MSIAALEFYDVSPSMGCLWDYGQIKPPLPDELDIVRQTALALPDILPSGRIRSYLREILPDASESPALHSCSVADARASINHYLFLAQAYVWGERDSVRSIPKCLAAPIYSLATRLGQPPILTYRNYVLDNWTRLQKTGEVVLENIRIPLQFLGGQDEHWFIAVHVAIEAVAAHALRLVKPLVNASQSDDLGSLQTLLEELDGGLDGLRKTFGRMTERCDPFIYYERVRPFIHGWKDNPNVPGGLVYEGVGELGEKPQQFRGETGAQSAIVPILDALLGVSHAENDDLRSYLDDLHGYRPRGHRMLIDDVSTNSSVRLCVSRAGIRALTDGYNACVSHVIDFRAQHLAFAEKYVFEQIDRANFGAPKIGTGGTPFVRYLGKHHRETAASLLPVDVSDGAVQK